MRQLVRVRRVSTSRVVPIRTTRKITRIGVISTMFTSHAASLTGTMSP